jgi:hypothetical protein
MADLTGDAAKRKAQLDKFLEHLPPEERERHYAAMCSPGLLSADEDEYESELRRTNRHANPGEDA